jgi:hypothetical protein
MGSKLINPCELCLFLHPKIDQIIQVKEDTIIALATPAGVGAISVIRISGPHSFSDN